MRNFLMLVLSVGLVACAEKPSDPPVAAPPQAETLPVEVPVVPAAPQAVEEEPITAPAEVVLPVGLEEGDEHLNMVRPSTLALEDFAEGDVLAAPFELNGKIRRDWVFEGSFPIALLTDEESIVAQGYGTADWLEPIGDNTEINGDDLIHFETTIEFEAPLDGTQGKLRFAKANPSGLIENDDYVEVMVLWE